ncbi:hypothetical protein [Marinactinospora rubrisoli]|uniref:Uncharacterized protein n=1 Tax=Marinactinospora rubrisoli TaxID=2715399 RepID=A0ABW2KJ78_9ACTN
MTTLENTVCRPAPDDTAEAAVRSRPSWPSLLGGALLVLVAVLAAGEVIAALMGLPPRSAADADPADFAGEARWQDPVVRLSSWILALMGLAPIVLALGSGLRRRWAAARRHRRPARAD